MRQPTTDARPAPLSGVRVIDLTRVLAGPYATMVLADLGAEVVKIERPGTGDDSRAFGPFRDGSSGYFASVNRGKQSCTLDLKSDEGRDILLRLIEGADVLVENFKPGVMEKLGLGWDATRVVNPRLVYVSCSGFGQTGPYASRPAYDVIVQGEGGLLSVTGTEGGPPVRVGVSLGDLAGALFTVIGIQAALAERERTGLGRWVDVAMLDAVVAMLENAIVRTDVEETAPGPLGTRHPSIAPFQAFPTRDGHVVVAAGNDRLWERLCRATGADMLLTDPRFVTNEERVRHHGEMEAGLTVAFRTRDTAQWVSELQVAGVPCGPLNRVDAVMADPQVAARNMMVDVADQDGHVFHVAGSPLTRAATGVVASGRFPALGEHTDEVLARLAGLDADTVAALRLRGVI